MQYTRHAVSDVEWRHIPEDYKDGSFLVATIMGGRLVPWERRKTYVGACKTRILKAGYFGEEKTQLRIYQVFEGQLFQLLPAIKKENTK